MALFENFKKVIFGNNVNLFFTRQIQFLRRYGGCDFFCRSKYLGISLLGHGVLFFIFSVSFGSNPSLIKYPVVNFRGSVLTNLDLKYFSRGNTFTPSSSAKINVASRKPGVAAVVKIRQPRAFFTGDSLKPALPAGVNNDKLVFFDKAVFPQSAKIKPVIMFYPRLPPYFNIYFQDRQVVHIELLFNISSGRPATSIAIKRKISSGNLEADLLSIRYISQYLFIQRLRFRPDSWQSVKIDLSTK